MVNECKDNFVDVLHSMPYVPIKLGLKFNSDDEAIFLYYNEYIGAIGFGIRKEYMNKNKVHG